MAVLQKYIDQGISVNTSYNPQHYEDEKIPMSDMLKHIIMFYKLGGKQLYYFNTYDGSGEIDVDGMNQRQAQIESVNVAPQADDADCDSCKI
jgi:ribonucleoside-diphosphate reductase alpha chain